METFYEQVRTLRRNFDFAIKDLQHQIRKHYAFLNSIPEFVPIPDDAVAFIKHSITELDETIAQLKISQEEALRESYLKHNAVSPTLEELGRLRGEQFVQKHSKYHGIYPYPTAESENERAYECKKCGWIVGMLTMEAISRHGNISQILHYCGICTKSV